MDATPQQPSLLERKVRWFLKLDDNSDEDIDRIVAELKANQQLWLGAEASTWFMANGYNRMP